MSMIHAGSVPSATPLVRHLRLDPEARLGLPSGPGTTPSDTTCFLITLIASISVYATAFAFREEGTGEVVWRYLTGFGRIPIPITVLSIWCLAFLLVKGLKIRAQRRALRIRFVPEETGWILTDRTADQVIDSIDRAADQPLRFLYLARCRNVLRMMRNLGRVADVDDAFNSRAEQDDLATDSGYTILRGFIWAIPVLGFIGTVIGLTQAMGRFGDALKAAGSNVDDITRELTKVLDGLDTAFITTAEALVAVIVIYLLQTVVRRADERLSDDMRTACTNTIVSRARVGH